MYLGLDIGTSSVKAALVDAAGSVKVVASRALDVSHPNPLWSEQNPNFWVEATIGAVDELASTHPVAVAAVRGVGLSGQMHGATLLDAAGTPLRPAILWNDGRSHVECRELEARLPALHSIAGNLAMPGFTAPKLLWVANHEPEIFRRTAKVLLPKAYVRFRLTGTMVEDMSDAAGTLWLDVGRRRWSEEILAACRMSLAQMPSLVEGSEFERTADRRPNDAMGYEARRGRGGRRGRLRGERHRPWGDRAGPGVSLSRHVGRAFCRH